MGAIKRLATGFEGTTNPGTTNPSAEWLSNGRGAMVGIQRTSGGVQGQAGDVYFDATSLDASSLDYRSRTPELGADVTGAEVLFCPRQGTPTPSGGDMPGLRVAMSWNNGVDDAGLFLDLQGNDVPGPIVDAELTVSHAIDGVPVVDDTYDLTAHDWFGWHRLTWLPSGAWDLSTLAGAVLASGTLQPVSLDSPGALGLRVQAEATNFPDGSEVEGVFNGAGALVDNLSVWITGRPAVRMYPRDDGRGMSSAPRIFPLPKSGRIIGGHQ